MQALLNELKALLTLNLNDLSSFLLSMLFALIAIVASEIAGQRRHDG
jgi:hypothetical protein